MKHVLVSVVSLVAAMFKKALNIAATPPSSIKRTPRPYLPAAAGGRESPERPATRWRVMQQKTVSGSGSSHVEQQIKAETSHGAQEGRRA